MNQKHSARAGLALVAVIFLAFVAVSQTLFRGAQLDFTENKLFTLSEGTKGVLAKVEEPVHLRFYFSRGMAQDIPSVRSYADRVEEMLEGFKEAANGKIRLSVIDPAPFSEDEDEATGFGLQGAQLNAGGDKLYFGLAGTNTIGDEVIVPFFQPEKEQFLEYDLSKLVYELANPQKTVIGLMSGLPVMGGLPPGPGQPGAPAWVLFEQMQSFFEIRNLREDLTQVPDDIDVLMVVHPKDWTEPTQYAIEQYILKGGHAAIFVDPWAERQPADPTTGQGDIRVSSLNQVFKAWGIEVIDSHIVGDAQYALQVQVAADRPPVSHLGIGAFQGDAFNANDITSQNLQTVNMASASYIWDDDDDLEEGKVRTETGAKLEPLIQSSELAQPIPAARFTFMPDPAALLDGFLPTGERYTVAARVTGEVPSAWPEGGPEGADVDNPVLKSNGDINVVLVADTDVLSDRLWVQVQPFLGQQIATPWANNGDFVVNVLDSLAGSSDLISIRSRAGFARPFTRVADIRKQAEQRFRHKEQELEAELRETEAQLTQLQQAKGDDNLSLSLTPEQEQLLEQFQDKQIQIRKDLREVRHQLDKDIEALGTRVKLINIALVPLLVALFAVFRAIRRNRKLAAA
jgi:ABC-type uncharacterized transport system involved in gliding motility auxiliary subunit